MFQINVEKLLADSIETVTRNLKNHVRRLFQKIGLKRIRALSTIGKPYKPLAKDAYLNLLLIVSDSTQIIVVNQGLVY